MKKIPKILLLFALVFQLMGGFGQTVVKADDILLSDANLSLKVNVYVADSSQPGGFRKIIDDGTVVSGGSVAEIEKGNGVQFEILWELDNASSYNAGDTITIPIPESYFTFAFTSEPHDITITNGTEVIGQFVVKQGEGVVITLNANAVTKAKLEEGYIRFSGTAVKLEEDGNKIEVGGEVIPLKINETTKQLVGIGSNFGDFFKGGRQVRNSNKIEWELLVNMENYRNAFKGGAVVQLSNMILIDELGPNQSIGYDYSLAELEKRFSISMPIFASTENGEMSDYLAARARVNFGGAPYIFVADDSTYANIEAFVAAVEARPETYIWGIYEQGVEKRQTIVFKLPDMATTLLDNAYDEVAELQWYFDTILIREVERAPTAAAYQNLQNNNGGKIPLLAYRIMITVDVTDLSITNAENKAELRYGNNSVVSKDVSTLFSKYESGVRARDNGKIRIIKIDANTSAGISNATFKLQVYDTVLGFIDYTPNDGFPAIRATVNGIVEFDKLDIGTYRIVEVSAATGYDISRVEFVTSDVFTVTGYEISAIQVTVKNHKTPDKPTTPGVETPKTGVTEDIASYLALMLIASLWLIYNKKYLVSK